MDFLAKFPQKLAASSQPGAPSYSLVPNLYATRREQFKGPVQGAEYLLDDGKIAVFKVEPDAPAPDGKVGAVYALIPGGSIAVPTGQVFIRLADGIDVSEHREELSSAGYKVAETLAYAPNAAWLQARSGDIADALNGLAALKQLPNVESVEPQMLMESVRR